MGHPFWELLKKTPILDPEAGSGYRGDDAPPIAPLSEEAVGGRVPVRWQDAASLKRARKAAGGEGADQASKRVKAENGAQEGSGTAGPVKGSKVGATVTIEVAKPEGLVGQLVIGPIGAHQRCIYGRLPANDVVVEHASVSRQHLALTFDVASGGVLLTDLQSGHGTQLNECWIKPHVAKQLRVGSKFRLGASTRTYKVTEIEVHKR
ncbi:hypothetical protein DUNSADRAFT_996 [Dunaliella salina]|uniref:FHA domain-containing protein n=1 Tax=Dunaliella salina TaxID=3046 RepID=A0ABQ7FY64_DUNSA|nr:hypothetical protein DUNSADRAFT_996 [Dunaliella salina]|eukprot:KAF5827290.1 hypothetical protein DUNSADRAFT_996 [Dunaliella salina]